MLVQNPTNYPNSPYVVIPLKNDLFCKISPQDHILLSRFTWYAQKSFRRFYVLATITFNGKKKKIRMHRLIADTKLGQICHHINGDTLDNRRDNLMNLTNEEHIQYFSKR